MTFTAKTLLPSYFFVSKLAVHVFRNIKILFRLLSAYQNNFRFNKLFNVHTLYVFFCNENYAGPGHEFMNSCDTLCPKQVAEKFIVVSHSKLPQIWKEDQGMH